MIITVTNWLGYCREIDCQSNRRLHHSIKWNMFGTSLADESRIWFRMNNVFILMKVNHISFTVSVTVMCYDSLSQRLREFVRDGLRVFNSGSGNVIMWCVNCAMNDDGHISQRPMSSNIGSLCWRRRVCPIDRLALRRKMNVDLLATHVSVETLTTLKTACYRNRMKLGVMRGSRTQSLMSSSCVSLFIDLIE